MRGYALFALVVAMFVALAPGVRAQGLIERLITPGPLVEGHAKFENDCGKCHEAFTRNTQPQLCLDCHKEIAADRERKIGFHGKQPEARSRDCRACHTEHKGRGADISTLDPDRFDHEQTNFRLVDSHAKVDCNACHAPKIPFHKTKTECVGCHAKVDPHKGRLGDRCENCHTPAAWRNVKPFDHGKTKFPLEGSHATVVCATCHAGQVYKDLPQACVACHRIQDVHGGRYGPKCETCHRATHWKEAHFDHSATKFPLHGAHASVKCDACHTGDLYAKKLETACVACHRPQDPHKGELGDRCERCHADADWRRNINFNHNNTRFPLVGQHADAQCESCHKSQAFKGAPVKCESCHQDTFHKGRLGAEPECGACHNAFGWKQWRFDHARQTRFALTGSHERLACEKCHTAANPATLKLPTACIACHKDYHRGNLGAEPKCESCHDTVAWPRWRFNHAALANYPLIGGHASLTCERCHVVKNPPNLKLASECISCHRRDDTHHGSFGPACERCHTSVGWRRVTIRQ